MRPFNKHTVIVGLAAATSALLLAACGSSSSSDNNGMSASASPGLVSVKSVDGTDVLANAQGRTLYTTDAERSGIHCTGQCTSFWRPAGASASDAKSTAADLSLAIGTVQRPDGERQLTFHGLPLYTFTQEGPGELDGNGFVDDFQGTQFHWKAAATGAVSDSTPSSSSSSGYSSGY